MPAARIGWSYSAEMSYSEGAAALHISMSVTDLFCCQGMGTAYRSGSGAEIMSL